MADTTKVNTFYSQDHIQQYSDILWGVKPTLACPAGMQNLPSVGI